MAENGIFKAIPKTWHTNFFHSRTDFNCFHGAPLGLSAHCAQSMEERSARQLLFMSRQQASVLLSTAKHRACFLSCKTQATGSRTAAHASYFVVWGRLVFEGNILPSIKVSTISLL